ncbi:MAG: PIN domain-containing protein [Fibromonadales bacterium]|nr:PIN domain-containing protein [Fibromonadales bacterium]
MENIEQVVIDTNVVLRFLLNDDEEQSYLASQVIANANCIVPIEVITEAIFVLSKVYSFDRTIICEKIKDFAKVKKSMLLEREIVCHACEVYAGSALDFVDCLIDGYTKIKGCKAFTFDKKLRRTLGEKYFHYKN